MQVPEGAAVPELVKLKMETEAKLAEVELICQLGIPQDSTWIGTMMKTYRIVWATKFSDPDFRDVRSRAS